MELYNALPVFRSTYDLLLAYFRFTKEFGKEYKYTLGERLKKETNESLTARKHYSTAAGATQGYKHMHANLYTHLN
jgi:hypothetical protein